MPKEIIWSEKASSDFEQTIDFLLNKWNKLVANNFIEIIDSNLLLVMQNPLLFPEINSKKKIHKCVINKYNSIVYKNNLESIEIVRILNNRKEPVKF